MAIIQEVLDAISAVANTVDNLRTLSDAIREGTDYIKTKHPKVSEDLVTMCEEMRKSSQALAAASSIITHFRFVIGDDLSGEASRFNQHLIAHKAQAEELNQLLNSMRGHCSVIANHAEKIKKEAESRGLKSLFSVLGLYSEERELELSQALQSIYDEEMQYHQNVYSMTKAIGLSLEAIQNTLGPSGMIDPAKLPDAAKLLGEYADKFSKLEANCNYNALQLQRSIDQLRDRAP